MASMIIISDITLTLGMVFYHFKVQFSYLQSNNTDGSVWSLRSLPTPELYLIIFFRKIGKRDHPGREEPALSPRSVTLSSVSHPSTDKEKESKFPAQATQTQQDC